MINIVSIISKSIMEDMEQYNGEYESFLDLTHGIFQILCYLSSKVEGKDRKIILGAINYYIAPIDSIMPADIFGAYAYVPCMFAGIYAIHTIDTNVLADSAIAQLQECEKNCLEILSSKEVVEIIEYIYK